MDQKHRKVMPAINERRPEGVEPVYGAYLEQPITKPDRRFPKTNVARPSDESVEENRDWVNFNKK